MSRITSPIVLRTGLTRYWQNNNNYKININQRYTNYFWLFVTINALMRELYIVKPATIDICQEEFFLKVYIVVLVLWIKGFDPKFYLRKDTRKTIFSNYLKKHFLTSSFLDNSGEEKIGHSFLKHMGKKEQEKSKAIVSSKFITARLAFSKRKLMPIKFTLDNVFSLSIKNVGQSWNKYYNSIRNILWYNAKKKYFMSTLKVLFVSSMYYSADMMSVHLAAELRKIRRHNELIFFIKSALPYLNWYQRAHKAIKIEIKGCIQDALRTKKISMSDESYISVSEISANPSYSLAHSYTAFGSLGIRTWYARSLFFKEKNDNNTKKSKKAKKNSSFRA